MDLIDYKTDLEPANHSASYAQQLQMYERALAIAGLEGVASQIHHVRLKPEEP